MRAAGPAACGPSTCSWPPASSCTRAALAELATGEGKTLTASLPAFLNALEGKGVHVTTVNDYLARRDAEWMAPIYEGLGLTVGVLQQQMGEQDRTAAYRCDITYGTASEFGFDFLRDRLKAAGAKGQEAPFWAPWVKGSVYSHAGGRQRPAAAPLRPGGRGRQHLHRRGPHAAHHQHGRRGRPRRRSRSSTTGPTSWPGR